MSWNAAALVVTLLLRLANDNNDLVGESLFSLWSTLRHPASQLTLTVDNSLAALHLIFKDTLDSALLLVDHRAGNVISRLSQTLSTRPQEKLRAAGVCFQL